MKNPKEVPLIPKDSAVIKIGRRNFGTLLEKVMIDRQDKSR